MEDLDNKDFKVRCNWHMRAANEAYNFESRFAIWYDENIKLDNHLIPYISLIIVYVLYNRGYYSFMAHHVNKH